MKPVIARKTSQEAKIYADEARIYQDLSKEYYHKTVNNKINEYVNQESFTNTLDNSLITRDNVQEYQQINIRKFSTQNADIYFGDCLDVLKNIKNSSIDLIVTSPPYADQRKNTYGGIHPDKYVEWFLPRTSEFKRILKSTGSFILNIKERVHNGERHTYVIELILQMKKQGWLWTEEYMWHKKNSYPGKWPNRFRDSWERLLHFTKEKQFKMFQDSVKVPMGNWAKQRLKNLSETDMIRDKSKVSSGFGKNISNWLDKDMVYPTNVLNLATECGNKNHSAAFPESLPNWFIRLFTEENDIILDPFAGSGTTLISANKLKRKAIGIDINKEYIDLMLTKLSAYDK